MSGTISFDGLATGIKASETVDKLIQVESRPKILKEAEKTHFENRLTAWQEINTKLLAVSVASGDLARLATWSSQKVTSSDETLLTARAGFDAPAGTYTLTVDQLARAHQVASRGYTSSSGAVASGELNVQVGSGATHTITIDNTNNTLDGAAAAINKAKIGVTASVVAVGGSYKLLLASNASGVSNQLTVTGAPAADLVFDFANPVQAAQNAKVRLGSGDGAIVVESASNSVDTLIKGVTLDLKAANPGKEVTVSLTRNGEGIGEKMKAFVDAYNDAASYIAKQFAFDPQKNVAGVLIGDSALMGVQRALSSLVLRAVENGSPYRTLTSVGVKMGEGGQLAFDAAKLANALENDFTGVMHLFRTSGDSTHSRVSFVQASKDTQETTDGYAVDVTRMATRAVLTGTGAAGLSIDATNDTLAVSVDNGTVATVTLAHRSDYTAATLAAELQEKINVAGGSVTVSADVGGVLSITSDRYGSSSRLAITAPTSGGSALAALGLEGLAPATGQDVAGTINGEAATGTGQILKGAADNKKANGLQVLVALEGGLVAGPQATVTVIKGVVSRLDEYLSSLTDPASGAVVRRQESINESLTRLQDRIKEMETRLESRRETLLAQFRSMEKAIGTLNGQGNFLTNALGGLSKNWQWNS